MTDVLLVGISHRVAPVELRERVALTHEQAAALAGRLAAAAGEAIVLSTCNRTEIYLAGDGALAAEADAIAALAQPAGLSHDDLRHVAYRFRGAQAAEHLFRVASGLDSLVPGEGQILRQVREAYGAGSPGTLLERMFGDAVHAGRAVRAETSVGEVPASVAAAAAALAEQLFGDLDGCRVALVGAGKTGDLAARSLTARGARIALVANRSPEKARELASRYRTEWIELDALPAHLAAADVVVCSTSARGYVLDRAAVEAAARARKGRPLFFIDIAVPRDVDPAVHELDDCFVYDIDDLEAVVTESTPGHEGETARAEAIVRTHAARFASWRASRDVAGDIASLRARAEAIRAAELRRASGRLERLTDSERKAVEMLTARIVDKLLHVPTVRLKEAAAGAEGAAVAGALRRLFDLGDDAGPGRHARK